MNLRLRTLGLITAGATVTGSISMRRTRNGGSGRVDGYVDAGDEQFLKAILTRNGKKISQGKVRYIGCSNLPAWQLVEAHFTAARQRRSIRIGKQYLAN